MGARLLACLLAAISLAPAAKKTVATATGGNQDLSLTVTLTLDETGIKQLIGDDLGGHYIVAEVKVEPKSGKEIFIDRDDFVLRTDKDGEKTTPFAPSMIAGTGALIVKQTSTGGGGGLMTGYPGSYPGNYPPPVYPGSGPPGPPVMMPGAGGAGVGSGGGVEAAPTVAGSSAGGKPNPLEKTLREKELPGGKTAKPAAGLLYFPLEKQKMKDLELTYGGRESRIALRFK